MKTKHDCHHFSLAELTHLYLIYTQLTKFDIKINEYYPYYIDQRLCNFLVYKPCSDLRILQLCRKVHT